MLRGENFKKKLLETSRKLGFINEEANCPKCDEPYEDGLAECPNCKADVDSDQTDDLGKIAKTKDKEMEKKKKMARLAGTTTNG